MISRRKHYKLLLKKIYSYNNRELTQQIINPLTKFIIYYKANAHKQQIININQRGRILYVLQCKFHFFACKVIVFLTIPKYQFNFALHDFYSYLRAKFIVNHLKCTNSDLRETMGKANYSESVHLENQYNDNGFLALHCIKLQHNSSKKVFFCFGD